MKTRKIALLSAIVILGGIYILQLAFGGKDSVKLLTLADKPDTLVIAQGSGSPLTIAQNGDKWFIGDKKYPANSAVIDAMVSSIGTVKALGTVSGAGDYDRYGLEDRARITVTALKAGKSLRTIAVGKNAVTSQQSYVLLDEGNDVQLVDGNLKDTFGKSLEDLRSRDIWSISPDSITKIEAAGFVLEKAGNPAAWAVTYPVNAKNFALDGEKAAAWVAGFATLKAESYAIEDITPPSETVGAYVVTGGGKTITFTLYAKDVEGRYLCSSSECPYPFYLSAQGAEKFLKSYRDFTKS